MGKAFPGSVAARGRGLTGDPGRRVLGDVAVDVADD
jgi:hypothetical protein